VEADSLVPHIPAVYITVIMAGRTNQHFTSIIYYTVEHNKSNAKMFLKYCCNVLNCIRSRREVFIAEGRWNKCERRKME
jgi:hypothetical protein